MHKKQGRAKMLPAEMKTGCQVIYFQMQSTADNKNTFTVRVFWSWAKFRGISCYTLNPIFYDCGHNRSLIFCISLLISIEINIFMFIK